MDRDAHNESSFGDIVHIFNEDFYPDFFEKYPRWKNTPKKEIRKTVNGFFDKAFDILVHQPNGIVFDGIGYICFASYTKGLKHQENCVGSKKNVIANKGLRYTPYFYCPFNNYLMRGFMIALNKRQKNKWTKVCRKGEIDYLVQSKQVTNATRNARKRIFKSSRVHRR
jgi:hypothetical protein